jgi:hypothetical protein
MRCQSFRSPFEPVPFPALDSIVELYRYSRGQSSLELFGLSLDVILDTRDMGISPHKSLVEGRNREGLLTATNTENVIELMHNAIDKFANLFVLHDYGSITGRVKLSDIVDKGVMKLSH